MVDIFSEVLPFTDREMTAEDCCRLILRTGQLEIRDVEGGEDPFEYSASTPEVPFYGPGYLLVKALVGWDDTFFQLINQLALRVAHVTPRFELICGNVSGGMVPAFLLKIYLTKLYGSAPVYLYAREMRKQHGSSEMLVGFANNPHIRPGMNALDVEELVNQANTTCHAAQTLRVSGLRCTHAATILDYQNPRAIADRETIGLTQISLTTLPMLIDVAEEVQVFPQRLIEDYRRFRENPAQWQRDNAAAITRVHRIKHPDYKGA